MQLVKTTPPISAKDAHDLLVEITALADDPYAFVMFIFPWGKKGTPLEHHTGPRAWQRDELNSIRDHIAMNRNLMARGKAPEVYKSATTSGRGTGKSSLVAWLNIWMMSTRLGATCINTANNETQLKTRTWAELGKWHTLALNSLWFEKTAMSLKPAEWFEVLLKKQLGVDTGYYYAQAQLWSEENPDAFAGVHNHNGILLVFDEASGIPAPIWKVSEGFFTEPVIDRYHFVFSNPRRNTGEFFECFHRFRDYWKRRHLDSRKVEGTDKKVLNDIVTKYGEDSDEARIEVKGEFPRQGDAQFINRELISQAVERELEPDDWAPLIMGVDPARYGDDATIIRFRQGRDARSIPFVKMKGADNMVVANKVAELAEKYNPDAICIDAGNGTGIIDRLRERGFKVHEVWFGGGSPEPEWANFRTYMWAKVRDWLGGGMIDRDPFLMDDLAGPEYRFQKGSDKLVLESKEEMKRRGLASPDHGDALACTFAVKVASRAMKASRGAPGKARVAKDADWSPFT